MLWRFRIRGPKLHLNAPMNSTTTSLLLLCAGLAWLPSTLGPAYAAETPAATAAAANARAVTAAQAFLDTLDAPMRQAAVFAFRDEAQRQRWSNLPSGLYSRKGLRLGDLKGPQRKAAMDLLAAALSPEGYQKVVGILEGDETLRGGGPGGRLIFGRDEYFVSFLGQPSTTEPWSLQFGGHHLALNLTWVGDRGTLAPSHTATQPARFTLDGKTVRPLGKETDLGFELINALDESARKKAILGAQFRDLVLGPGQEYRTLVPEGVPASSLTEPQRKLLLDLIHQWVGILPEGAAAARMAEIRATLNDTWFAWSGPTRPGSAAYFRIQGPAVFIELAPQNLGGDPTQHLHTIYRDPANEYGRKWWKP